MVKQVDVSFDALLFKVFCSTSFTAVNYRSKRKYDYDITAFIDTPDGEGQLVPHNILVAQHQHYKREDCRIV